MDIASPVGDALKLLRASAPATVQIERNLVSGTIMGDPTQIHQVVLNLCTNALHAMAGEQGTLVVSLEPVEVDERLASEIPNLKPGEYMRLMVSDTGHGMDPQTVSRIFDPFFTTKKPGEGTGLGLAMVQGIVHTHDGAMSVSSESGKGTVFELYFPLSTQSRPKADSEEPAKPGNREEILVVDDEQSVGTFAATRLQQFNYSVTVFRDPREALEAFRNGSTKYDAIVTDLTMPHLTGVELIEKLRETSPKLPAIVISGYNRNLASTKLTSISNLAVLMKPFTGEELARSLHLLLREREPVA
jgi:CheY-like chemotaxis protein